MNQEKPNENLNDSLAPGNHNKVDVMTESIVFDDTNPDLHSKIPSVLPNNNPQDSSYISLLTTQPDSIHQKSIEYNKNQSFKDRLEETKNVYNNHITDSTRLQYLFVNISLVIFLFKNYCNLILQPYADENKEWYENESFDVCT